MKMSEEWENYCLTCGPLRVNYKHTKHVKYSHTHTERNGRWYANPLGIGNQIRINMNLFCRNVKMKHTSAYSNKTKTGYFLGHFPAPVVQFLFPYYTDSGFDAF